MNKDLRLLSEAYDAVNKDPKEALGNLLAEIKDHSLQAILRRVLFNKEDVFAAIATERPETKKEEPVSTTVDHEPKKAVARAKTYPPDRVINDKENAIILPIGKVNLKTGANEMHENIFHVFEPSGVVLYQTERYYMGNVVKSYYMVLGSGEADGYLGLEGGMLIHSQTRQKLGYDSRIVLTGPLSLSTLNAVQNIVGKTTVNCAVYK